MTGYIYRIKNNITNQSYIGQTIDFNRRRNTHLNKLKQNKHDNPKLQAAFNKYGEDNFSWEVWTFNNITSEQLNQLEIDYIYKFDSLNNGYNLVEGGGKPPLHKKVNNDDMLIALCIITNYEQCGKTLESILGYSKGTMSRLYRRLGYTEVLEKFDSLTKAEQKEIADKYYKEWNIEEIRYNRIGKRGNTYISKKAFTFSQDDYNMAYAAREEGYGYTCVALYMGVSPATVKDWFSGRSRQKNLDAYKRLSFEEKQKYHKLIPKSELEKLENDKERLLRKQNSSRPF